MKADKPKINPLVRIRKELAFEIKERGKRAAELSIANQELAHQNEEKAKRAVELVLAKLQITGQNEERERLSALLASANIEVAFQNEEKGKRASELSIANGELYFQNEEKEKRASELVIANRELVFQNAEKEKRAAELLIANGKLIFQNREKENRASELIIANTELVFQNGEKEKRATELIIAYGELAFQNAEKEKRAAELVIANTELVFQNEEKEKRASELVIANRELVFQDVEKEKRAAELALANKELAFQSGEREKRAAELVIANEELAFQNREKEKRAAELIVINAELEAFSYVSSHDLQEPLRKIQTLCSRILQTESQNLSDQGKGYFSRVEGAATRMRLLIDDLLAFSRLNLADRKSEMTDLEKIIEEVKNELKEVIEERHLTIETVNLCKINIIPFQFRQIMFNLISNALKFSRPSVPPHIVINCVIERGAALQENKLEPARMYCYITFSDNGIGFEPQFKDRIFEVFQRLHGRDEYAGSGIGLAIVKKIIDNHHGIVTATGEVDKGATIHIYIPVS
jgi:signal transduction histidine kinase